MSRTYPAIFGKGCAVQYKAVYMLQVLLLTRRILTLSQNYISKNTEYELRTGKKNMEEWLDIIDRATLKVSKIFR